MSIERIGLICPYDLSLPGGVQGQVRAMAVELVRRGRQVTVVSPGEHADPTLARHSVTQLLSGRTLAVPANGSRAPITLSLTAARWAFDSLRRDDVEVIHLHEPLTPVLGWSALRHFEGGLVGTFHRSGASPGYRALGSILRSSTDRLDVAVAVSSSAADTAQRCAGVRCEVLFNGVEVQRDHAAEPWPTRGPTILFLGRDEPRKGRDVLIAAGAHLPPTTTIWVTGDPPRLGSGTGGARVEYLGVIDDEEKQRRLEAADVLCAPSLGGESFGIVLLEGLAAGCVVVASDIDGYRQALGSHGLLVAPGDEQALASALEQALALSGPPSTESRSFVESWSMTRLMDRYEERYLIAATHGGRRRQD